MGFKWNKRRAHLPNRLGTSFTYIPRIKPDPPSTLRQIAYREGSPILGPDTDPDGWKTLNPAFIRGTVFNDRSITTKCTVSYCITYS
jgi:hypothetical protein